MHDTALIELSAIRTARVGTIASATLAMATSGEGFFEITREVARFLENIKARDGAVLLYLRHTSASLVIQENADPEVQTDLVTALARIAPADAGWVLKPEALRAYLEEKFTGRASATCLVRTHDQAATDLRASLPASLLWQPVEGALVDSIADIARKEEQSSRPCPDAQLDAYYIRRPDAETNWKD